MHTLVSMACGRRAHTHTHIHTDGGQQEKNKEDDGGAGKKSIPVFINIVHQAKPLFLPIVHRCYKRTSCVTAEETSKTGQRKSQGRGEPLRVKEK